MSNSNLSSVRIGVTQTSGPPRCIVFSRRSKTEMSISLGISFAKKRKLLRRLHGISRSLARGPNDFLEQLQKELREEYAEVLVREELLWFQKSRCKWLAFGDKNSKYFHGVTKIRRRQNSFDTLQTDDGTWITSREELETMTTNFDKNLFNETNSCVPFCLIGTFPTIEDASLRGMGDIPFDKEIHDILKSIGGLKAPGPDGIQVVFYQSQWSIVGPAVCHLVKNCFANPTMNSSINETLITLIPKVEAVVSMKDFRPIGLCNVSYKIITKLLARRLRTIMEDLISPHQCSFVPNRHSSDNIIIAQEVIHSMRTKKGPKGWMAIKIDLKKAYDRLSWDFVRSTLQDIGMPSNYVDLVWHCISTPCMRVIWNGEALEEFTPSRGIRHGDPISPYLFVLCIDRLSHLINLAVNEGLWKPISLARGGPSLSHLMFVDDLVLFSEATVEQANVINMCLDLFCQSSGQKVSMSKTQIFFS